MVRKWRTYFALTMIFILLFNIPFMSHANSIGEQIHPSATEYTNDCETMSKFQASSVPGSQLDKIDCEEAEEDPNANDPITTDEPTEEEKQQQPPAKNEGDDAEVSGEDQEKDDAAEQVEKEKKAEDQEEITDEDEEKGTERETSDQPDPAEKNQETDESSMTHEAHEPEEKEQSKEDGEQVETEGNDSEKKMDVKDEAGGEHQANATQSGQLSGLAGVSLLNNTNLEAEQTTLANGMERITLTYSGRGLLNLDLLASSHTIFRLPPEIMDHISPENISATYNVPGLLGIIRNRGEFSPDQIHLDKGLNQVSMDFFNLLSLSILASYTFTLSMDLEEIPPTQSGDYTFYAHARSQLVDLSLLSGNDLATTSLSASELPSPPIINEPVYTTDTTVAGTAEPNTTVYLRIGNEVYDGQVNAQGDFSVNIPQQTAGTEIRGTVENAQGYESAETSVTVMERPDAPVVDPVYSNDTIVMGTGDPNGTIVLTIDGTTYVGDVDEDGNFAITIPEQAPGTVITAVLISETGYMSENTEVIVKEATISFYHVPETLAFAEVTIESGLLTVPRQNPDWSLEVKDTRGPGSTFSIFAEAEQPLTTADGSHVLPDALVYVDDYANSHSLTNGPVEVFAGQTGEEQITSIGWDENQGPMVEVVGSEVYADAYETTITWTLVDAP